MGFLDRILLFVAMLSLVFLSLFALLLAFGLLSLEQLGTSIALLYGRLDVGLVALFFLLASLRLFYLALGRRGQGRGISSRTELGELKISFAAVENLIQRTVRQIRGARETRVRVKGTPGGIAVKLQVVVNPEENVPALSKRIQEAICLQVRETMGIEVAEVNVHIANIGQEALEKKIE
ncbi:MAG TPA: alkaline shock response membrane anchor protein AmaP [Firmicutes bacterium]|nr:alkaline shock response membrane anchor protein AmaP [Bacillota bacterium]